MKDVKKWLMEGAKTALRFFVAVAIPAALDALLQGVQVWLTGVPTLQIGNTEKWIITMVLVAADKAIHEWKKKTKTEGVWKGLIGF